MKFFRIAKPLKGSEGSFTVEASLVLPIVLFVTMTLVFFCLYVYQQSFLHQTASAVAERAAYSWDNSHKQAATYQVGKGQYDSLYWRLSEDGMLGALFGWTGITENTETVPMPGGNGAGGSLPVIKMNHSGSMVPPEMKGEISYKNTIVQRTVRVDLTRMLSLPPLDTLLKDGSDASSFGNSAVVEPVEFIRTVDLMRYYASKFKGTREDAKTDPGSAAEVLNQFRSSGR